MVGSMWRFADIPFALRSYVNCQYPLEPARRTKITLRPSVNIKYWISAVPRSSRHARSSVASIMRIDAEADRQAETLISGNVKHDATRGKGWIRGSAKITIWTKMEFSPKALPEELCSRPNITTSRRFTARVVHKSKGACGVARIRTDASCS